MAHFTQQKPDEQKLLAPGSEGKASMITFSITFTLIV